MSELRHGFRLEHERCDGCLACMRSCPTFAIRVWNGKARLLTDLCIDCGWCLKACSRGAIAATTRSLSEIGRFAFKVAVPSPVLFGQFPAAVTPDDIVDGLLAAGFDAVWDYGIDIALVARAVASYVETWRGPRPLVSSTCPVIVRLAQVSYPSMLEQLVHIHPPREIAGREIKRRYSAELGLPPEEIAAIYITPCQARIISIIQPAEGGKSHLDGAIGIGEIYNTVLAAARSKSRTVGVSGARHLVRTADMLRWSTSEALSRHLFRHRYLTVTGLTNVIQVFDDVEKGKLRNIEFLECYACWGGCLSGNLTVDNLYVSLTKLHKLISDLSETDSATEAEIARRYPAEDYALERPIRPRPLAGIPGDLRERVRKVNEAEAILATLPGLDCGLCGAPNCRCLARDVSTGDASRADCVFLSTERLEELKRFYQRSR